MNVHKHDNEGSHGSSAIARNCEQFEEPVSTLLADVLLGLKENMDICSKLSTCKERKKALPTVKVTSSLDFSGPQAGKGLESFTISALEHVPTGRLWAEEDL